MEPLYRLERLVNGKWKFVQYVRYKNHPCCSTYERVV